MDLVDFFDLVPISGDILISHHIMLQSTICCIAKSYFLHKLGQFAK